MIEDLPAVDEIDDIAAVPGIDLVSIGPSDLSQALGVAAESRPPEAGRRDREGPPGAGEGRRRQLAFPMNHSPSPATPPSSAKWASATPTARRLRSRD